MSLFLIVVMISWSNNDNMKEFIYAMNFMKF